MQATFKLEQIRYMLANQISLRTCILKMSAKTIYLPVYFSWLCLFTSHHDDSRRYVSKKILEYAITSQTDKYINVHQEFPECMETCLRPN